MLFRNEIVQFYERRRSAAAIGRRDPRSSVPQSRNETRKVSTICRVSTVDIVSVWTRGRNYLA